MAPVICLQTLIAIGLVIVASGAVVNHEPKILEASEESARSLFSPQPREWVATQFLLYTPERKDDPQIINNTEIDSWNAAASGFKAEYKTKFITHGFNGADAAWTVEMKDALLKTENMNVFILDWDSGDGPIYEQAYANIRVVGEDIALLIKHLMNTVGLKPEDVHLIGHSLGAHASGFAGKNVQAFMSKKIGRISGLDPAGPDFYYVDPIERLDATDALFVDAIHTNWAYSSISGFGIEKAIAHFDFYPNGGEEQPGCPTATEAIGSILGNIFSSKDAETQYNEGVERLACAHSRAYELFTASIESNSCNFESLQCDYWWDYRYGDCGTCADHKCVQMGYKADQYKDLYPGEAYKKFYLETTATSPYCMKEL